MKPNTEENTWSVSKFESDRWSGPIPIWAKVMALVIFLFIACVVTGIIR